MFFYGRKNREHKRIYGTFRTALVHLHGLRLRNVIHGVWGWGDG
jgi:hypothetical protein